MAGMRTPDQLRHIAHENRMRAKYCPICGLPDVEQVPDIAREVRCNRHNLANTRESLRKARVLIAELADALAEMEGK